MKFFAVIGVLTVIVLGAILILRFLGFDISMEYSSEDPSESIKNDNQNDDSQQLAE